MERTSVHLAARCPRAAPAVGRAKPLFDRSDREVVERLVDRLLSHKVWDNPDPGLNDLRDDNAEPAKEMLAHAGLTPNWMLGGSA